MSGRGFSNPAMSVSAVAVTDAGSCRTYNTYDYITADNDPPAYMTAAAGAGSNDDEDYLKPSTFCDYCDDDYYETVKMIDNSDDCIVKYVNY